MICVYTVERDQNGNLGYVPRIPVLPYKEKGMLKSLVKKLLKTSSQPFFRWPSNLRRGRSIKWNCFRSKQFKNRHWKFAKFKCTTKYNVIYININDLAIYRLWLDKKGGCLQKMMKMKFLFLIKFWVRKSMIFCFHLAIKKSKKHMTKLHLQWKKLRISRLSIMRE